MQVTPGEHLSYDEVLALDERMDGAVSEPVPYDKELVDRAINDPDVEKVVVMKLRHGSRLKIGDEVFKVYRLNSKNATLKKIE